MGEDQVTGERTGDGGGGGEDEDNERSEDNNKSENEDKFDQNETTSDEDENKIEKRLSFASTNARSLPPKICSMIECFRELELSFFCITETWLKNDPATEREKKEMFESEKIKLLAKNRGTRGGGVCVAVNTLLMDMSIIPLPNNKYEVLGCVGRVKNVDNELVVITVYLPPKMSAPVLENFCEFLGDAIEHVKNKYNNPFVVITGDFNRKDISEALADFPDIELVTTAATRAGAVLDRTYTNFNHKINNTSVAPPLEANDGASVSDHKVVTFDAAFPLQERKTKRIIKFRPYTQRGEDLFGRMLATHDWSHLESSEDPAEEMRTTLDGMVDGAFPVKTRIIRERDQPWITPAIKRMARRKRREYKANRRSERWKQLQTEFDQELLRSRRAFFDRVKMNVKESGNTREYFKAVSRLVKGTHGREGQWNITDMFPGQGDDEVSEKVAVYFNRISSEYKPLEPLPRPRDSGASCPMMHEISSRLKSIKKPKSQVEGDIPPKLVQKYHDLLAIPMGYVFAKSYATSTWPKGWKNETVTVIPKNSNPKGLSELRNLSCTPLFSKVMESFVLQKLRTEISLSESQFGGIKGSGADHFLVETWDQILRGLEDGRAAVALAFIDFEKAFNRVCHHECLKAARNMGASEDSLSMIRAFLTGRTMSVKVNGTKSKPKNVPGGSPQGSIMGGALYCLTTDQLNKCSPSADTSDSLNITPAIENNGIDESFAEGDDEQAELSPIARPEIDELSLSDDEEEEEIRASDFVYFNPRNRWYDSELSIVAGQTTIYEEFGRPEGWQEEPLGVKVYIDDMNAVEKISQENATSEISQRKRILKIHAPKLQVFLERVSERASEIGMVVNQKKTQVLCISASIHDECKAYIRPTISETCTETISGGSLKIIGFHFNTKPTVGFHVEIMCQKFRCKLWSLRQLKKSGMGQVDLLVVYKTILRPVLEYACVTYGPMLTEEMNKNIEKLQLRVMKIIYGRTVSYNTVLEMTSLEILRERREKKLLRFAQKTLANERFASKWFPKANVHNYFTRNPKIFLEEKTRTNRLYNSPLYTMRRMLNATHQKD